ncbi:MAG: M24 family metallopeptidase, partial [Candidatus Marinimicrobia bacterium]|nr:M24 family metallopeptidase [Candidatus Neomarinimicrobiota bacterium]
FHGINPFGSLFLDLEGGHFTRRWFYFLPAAGEPRMLVHRIEARNFEHLPGKATLYSGWRELEQFLGQMLKGSKRIAMEYSPGNALPYVSKIDAGMVELIRGLGPEIASSADIIQYFHSRWTDTGYAAHKKTVPLVHGIRERAFETIGRKIKAGESVNEYMIQQQIVADFADAGLTFDHPPIVAVNANAAMPHYAPADNEYTDIHKGDLVLIDMWCKQADEPEATYVDITWTGFVGGEVPDKIAAVFNIVKEGRDSAVEFVAERLSRGHAVRGGEVDDACRQVIENAGYGEYFTHRTGHSIDTEVHGAGVNIDNLEVRDERSLIPGVGFSIEPGIYLPGEFGIRSEIDCYIGPDGIEVTTAPSQEEVLPLLTMFG